MRNTRWMLLWGLTSVLVAQVVAPEAVTAETADAGAVTTGTAAAGDAEYYELMKLFVDSFEEIERNYVKEIDRKELIEAALQGMLVRLDPYSSYLDKEDYARFDQEVEQEFGGIGIQVTIDPQTRGLMVMTPLPGTPAYQAGIRAGDRVLQIDGKDTEDFGVGQEMEEAVRMMRGKPGESVKLKVQHEGEATPIDVDLVRAIIKTATVLGDRYAANGDWTYLLQGEPKIGYLRLTHFSRNSAEEMEEALQSLTRDGMQGLVLDLRFNPGGLLTAAAAISDQFVESGVIVSTRGRNTEPQVVQAKKAGTFTGFPMVVLVNRYSASASEIVSACLQDHHRAVVVGERTWGKGSVQNVIDLGGGSSALKLTTASYHRPSGKNIHRFPKAKETDEWGVMPDDGFKVEFSVEQMQAYLISRRDRDVLRSDGKAIEDSFTDTQLNKGLEYLKEQITGVKATTPEGTADKPATAETNAAAAPAPGDQPATNPPVSEQSSEDENTGDKAPKEPGPGKASSDDSAGEESTDQSSRSLVNELRTHVEATLKFYSVARQRGVAI